MSTYYEILNLTQGVSNDEVIKAYLHMLQKYPVERFSHEFMEITKAYEVLSNEKIRLEYDAMLNGSPELREETAEAKELSKKGEFEKTIKVLEKLNAKFPNLLSTQSLLGEAYLDNENTGKAIKVFEKLASLDSNNGSFVGHLGEAYLLRGWHKKALAQFEKAVKLDENNFSLWLGLSDTYTIANDTENSRKVFEDLIKKDGELTANAYMTLFVMDSKEDDMQKITDDLNNLYDQAVKNQNIKENIEWTLFLMSKIMINAQRFELAKEILNTAEKLSKENEEILELKNNVNKLCDLKRDIEVFEKDADFEDIFVYLVANKIIPDKSFEEEVYNRTSEYEFLINLDIYRRDIKLLSQKYPKIHEYLKGYFKKISKREERIKIIKEHEKYLQSDKGKLDMKAVALEGDEELDTDLEEEVQETYVREEPKIGRNDPCPCGSGKKYKKCCGR